MRIKINRKVLHCLLKEDTYAKLEKLCMKNNFTLTETITLCINGRYLNEFKTDKIEYVPTIIEDKKEIIEDIKNDSNVDLEELKRQRRERMSKHYE